MLQMGDVAGKEIYRIASLNFKDSGETYITSLLPKYRSTSLSFLARLQNESLVLVTILSFSVIKSDMSKLGSMLFLQNCLSK